MKINSILIAACIGICCSTSFIAGYMFHQGTMPERKSYMAALSFMNTESSIFETFDRIAFENFYFTKLSQVKNLEELEGLKIEQKNRLLEEITKLEKLTMHEKREYKIYRNLTMLKVTEKIKEAINTSYNKAL